MERPTAGLPKDNMDTMPHLVIIGNGISGVTAARFVRKLSPGHRITLISAESDYFFSRPALMYVYMGHQPAEALKPYPDDFWTKNRIERRRARVERVDFGQKTLHFAEGGQMAYDQLLLATGSDWNRFGWPGQDLAGVHGLVSWQDLEAMSANSPGLRRAVVVGGGLIGIEVAEMYHARHIPVTFLVREQSYWDNVLPAEESAMINRHIREHGIDLRLGTELAHIEGDAQGRAAAAHTRQGERIACGAVALTAGVSPKVGFLKNSGLDIGRGILVDAFLRSNIPDVYAIGDCAELRQPRPGRRPIEALWYTGRMMGETVAYTLCGQPKAYDPGPWFNSAKFFDIEYQVYGEVPPRLGPEQESLYWEHPKGRHAIRLVFERATGRILGFNLMGIRYRQELCLHWIAQGCHVEVVLQHLKSANFDPEFFPLYEDALLAQYQARTGRSLPSKGRRRLDSALRWLRGPKSTKLPD